jgi:hypothetical protein
MAQPVPRPPSGLFPSGPPRPTYREVFPVGLAPLVAGAGAATLWMMLFGLLATSARGYAWFTIGAGIVGWVAAAALARFGDRGVAAGVALACGLGIAIAGVVVVAHLASGNWLLW